MTVPRRDGCEQDGFRAWLRAHPRLHSVRDGWVQTDCDLLIHKYKTIRDRISDRTLQHMMWLEYKQFGKELSDTQRDTLYMLHQLFRTKRKTVVSSATRRKVTLRFWGVHLLTMSGETPESSEWMIWDKTTINRYDLERLLRFEINPINLKPITDRRHHRIGGT